MSEKRTSDVAASDALKVVRDMLDQTIRAEAEIGGESEASILAAFSVAFGAEVEEWDSRISDLYGD